MTILKGVYLSKHENHRFYNLVGECVHYGFFSTTFKCPVDKQVLDSLENHYLLIIPREFLTGKT